MDIDNDMEVESSSSSLLESSLPPAIENITHVEIESTSSMSDDLSSISSSFKHKADSHIPVQRLPTASLLRHSSPNMFAARIVRIQSDLRQITENPPEYCSASPKGDKFDEWMGTIIGPKNSPYEDGVFFLDIKFPQGYPFQPVSVRFLTRLYHCNINSLGQICLDVLKDKWTPTMTVSLVLKYITYLLLDCNPNNPLVGSIAKQFLQDKKEHDRVAREWTKRYAC